MSKNDIIKLLALKKNGCATKESLKECAEFLNILEEIIADNLKDGEDILWKGLLTIKVSEQPERKGRHPQTGEIVVYPPSKKINCKISEVIKEYVNGES